MVEAPVYGASCRTRGGSVPHEHCSLLSLAYAEAPQLHTYTHAWCIPGELTHSKTEHMQLRERKRFNTTQSKQVYCEANRQERACSYAEITLYRL
jgi:hypothetical protein